MPEKEIEKRYYQGFENLNLHWKFFDDVFLFETSAFKVEPKHILTIINQTIEIESSIPEYLNKLIPSILK